MSVVLEKREASEVDDAPVGKVRLFIDENGHLSAKDESGDVVAPQALIESLETLVATKQDAATAATDTELASERTGREAADATLTGAAAAAKATADAALPKAGGTMTGALTLAGDAGANLQPVTKQQLTAAINALVNGAPEALDTLKEISDRLGLDESVEETLIGTVATKLAKSANLSDLASASTSRANLGLGTAATKDSGAAGEAGKVLAADDPVLAQVKIINSGYDWSAGNNQKGFSADLLGQRQTILHGYNAAPDETVGPTVKIVRTSKISKAQIEAAGAVGTDGGDQLAAIMGIHVGVPGNGVQVVGLAGFAKNSSDSEDNPDAAGVYGIARITGGTSLAAGAFAFFGQARRDVATARATGAEIQVANFAGIEGAYVSNGASDTKALWVVPNGNADSAVGMQLQNAFGYQFLYGIAFGNQLVGGKTGPVKISSIRDDSSSETVLDVRGAHVNAIKLAAASGVVDLGKNAILNPPAALGNPYRQIGPPVAGRATAAAAAGTKYFLIPGASDVSAPAPQTTAAQSQPFLIVVSGADMGGVGTAKMRVKGIVITQNKPEITLTLGLYPVTGGATQALGEVVAGSTAVLEKPAANSDTSVASSDFTPPADGIYAIGYTVSGTPAVAFGVQARAEFHHV